MSLEIPSLQTLVDQNIAEYETQLNQTVPSLDKSYVRVQAVIEAMNMLQLYKFIADRSLENLALTSSEDGLALIGSEHGVTRKAATAAIIEIEFTSQIGITIDTSFEWTGDSNRVRYHPLETYVTIGTTTNIQVEAYDLGTDGNLAEDATLTLTVPQTGISEVAVVSDVIEEAIDQEALANYRRRVLTEIRTVGGGGNAVDYQRWAEEVEEVYKAYPYAGKPEEIYVDAATDISFVNNGPGSYDTIESTITDLTQELTQGEAISRGEWIEVSGSASNDGLYLVLSVSTHSVEVAGELTPESAGEEVTIELGGLPGDRTVYVQVVEDIDEDGIAREEDLAAVREAINFDPETGEARPALGDIDSTLYVESIYRTPIYVMIRDLDVGSGDEAEIETKVETALETYIKNLTPFVEGIDSEIDRADTVTSLGISLTVQDTLVANGSTASAVGFSLTTPFAGGYPYYRLHRGELVKLGSITWEP